MTDVELNQLAIVLEREGKYALEEVAARRSVPLVEVRTGRESADFAKALGTHGAILQNMGEYVDAVTVLCEALEIDRKTIGGAHPSYARHLSNWADMLVKTDRHNAAEPIYREPLAVFEAALGTDHLDTRLAAANLKRFLANSH